MRVTNNMIINKANTNINNNKVAVDKGNTQMTTQKRIDRPSEDPVIAVRSLRLQTALGKIDQYYEKNIPDADAWMDITETALLNINENMKEFRTLCVNGSTGTLTQDDRKTILQQLQSLQQSIFAQGNADYAGRTVFTGYRTNKDLVFTKNENDTNYNITDRLSADKMEKIRYYNGDVTVPTNESEINRLGTGSGTGGVTGNEKSVYTSEKNEYNRLRVGYDDVTQPDYLKFSYTDPSGNQVTKPVNLAQITYNYTKSDGTTATITQDPDIKDVAGASEITGRTVTASGVNNGTYQYKDLAGNTLTSNYTYQEVATGAAATDAFPKNVYIFENEDDWAMWSTQPTNQDGGKKYVPDDAMVMIKSTGDLIFGNDVASKMQANHVAVDVNYDKKGFDNGDLRPEYYYDSVNWTDPQNRVVYNREDNNYDIKYTIAQNLELTVNLQAWDVFNGDVQQDMKDMTSCVSRAIEAYDKLTKIETLQKDPAYQSEELQKKLKEWHELAQREYDFANDDMDKLFSSALGKSDEYYDKINLAITKLGCMKDQLQMTERRMDEQQQTVTDLQSQNDNLDLSEIIINYTASYTAYQSSLQAAGKLGQQTLLNYI